MEIKGLANTFRDQASADSARIFARGSEGEISFGMLSDGADAMARMLADAGVKRGDRVVVMMRNSPASLAMIYGLMRAGMVWVPANPALVGDALAHVIHLVEAALIVCDPDMEAPIHACGETARLGVKVIADRSLPAAPEKPWDGPEPVPRDLAAIMFTSGTTGPAKGVMVTHMMLEMSAEAVARTADARPGDNFFMWEPFFHIGGAQVILLPILRDISLTLSPRFSASRFWDEVRAGGATHIHHLGGVIQILLKQAPSPRDRDHKVRIAWGGGCAPSVWRDFEKRFGLEIRECYGMTEASSITSYNANGVLGSVGLPVPWFKVEVKDVAGRVLGPGEGQGEIVVTTSVPGSIFEGYYRNPEATEKALRADGFHTGDMGSWDAGGNLFFHGRMTDSVRCRGENVSAFEVESVANRHPDVDECAMVGVSAEIGEYDIQLFVRPRPGVEPDPAVLSSWLAERLAPYQRPRYIAFIDEFPKTPSQRIRKHLLPEAPEGRWDRENNIVGVKA